ncbi:hypothetical protein ACKFKG_25765 [Phormidesmis sp. 146-35]
MTYSDDPVRRANDDPAIQPSDVYITNTPVAATADYHDRVRWGPIFSGLVIALSSQLVLSALGAAIGLSGIANSGSPRSDLGGVGSAIGIWSIISLLISLFIGGWVTARACGPMSRKSALLNGAVLWATTLALSAWLVTSGVSGAFGVVASNAGEVVNQVQQSGASIPNNVPSATAEQTRNVAGDVARGGWSFAIGSLLGLIASLLGASIGTRRPETTQTTVRATR